MAASRLGAWRMISRTSVAAFDAEPSWSCASGARVSTMSKRRSATCFTSMRQRRIACAARTTRAPSSRQLSQLARDAWRGFGSGRSLAYSRIWVTSSQKTLRNRAAQSSMRASTIDVGWSDRGRELRRDRERGDDATASWPRHIGCAQASCLLHRSPIPPTLPRRHDHRGSRSRLGILTSPCLGPRRHRLPELRRGPS